MRDQDKPFICYKQGWSIKIVPRNAQGWRWLGLWLAAYGLLLAGYLAVAAALTDDSAVTAAIVGFLAISGMWAFAMIRWMLARSEVLNLKELIELKRKRDRESNRRR